MSHWRASLPSEMVDRLGWCLGSRAWGSSVSSPNSCRAWSQIRPNSVQNGETGLPCQPHKKCHHTKLTVVSVALWEVGRTCSHPYSSCVSLPAG